jgi:hypothetical protein
MELLKESISKAWIYKYMPKSINDLVINKSTINNITNWLDTYNNKKNNITLTNDSEFDNISDIIDDDTNIDGDTVDDNNFQINQKNIINNKSCMIIYGSHGIGKTVLMINILKNKNYKINTINFNKINTIKNINDYIDKIFNYDDIYNIMLNINDKRKKVLLIDNIESLSSPNEKNFVINIIKKNNNELKFPIIFISNNKHNKIINFIKKMSYCIEVNLPSIDSMKHILYNVCYNEKIKFDATDGDKIVDTIIASSKRDFRFLINNLEMLKDIYKNKIIDYQDILNFIKNIKSKDQDLALYDASKKLFYNYENIESTIRIFEIEKILLPLMIQQYYIDLLKNKKNNCEKINRISDTLSKGDIVENYIYEHNIYDIRDAQAYYQCIYPSYILSNTLNPSHNDATDYSIKYDFPEDLNKTSIRHINYTKNIVASNKIFTNMGINDYLYLNKIMNGIIKTDNFEECNSILKDYSCDILTLESSLKINKIFGNKFTISTKTRKKILQNCDNITEIKQTIKTKKIKKSKKRIKNIF